MVCVIKHPLIETKMSKLRDKGTGTKEFREICSEIATLLCYEATKDLPTIPITVDTPIETTICNTLERCIVFVPILRAGMGILDGMLNLIPTAKVGHIGLYRDPDTLNPIEYYCKLPSHSEHCDVFVLDPMLATGGTASAAINELKKRNISNIKLIVLVACPTGIQRIENDHPDVVIYAASNDSHLNEHGYIVPGLGDAGDRIFGTK